MNCINCIIKKCKNNDCDNYVRRSSNCWFDFETKQIDKLPFTFLYSITYATTNIR